MTNTLTTGPTPDPEGLRQWRFTAPPGATVITLVRHGESAPAMSATPFPMKDGQGDPELHPEGIIQARRLGVRLAAEHREIPIDAIYVTTLRRTHQTAAPLAEAIGVDPIELADLREVHLGDWEGGIFRQKERDGDPIWTEVFAGERWDVIPGAESSEAFTARIRAGIDRIAAAHPDQRVVSVSHGGVIGHILHLAAQSRPFAFAGVGNASISEIVVHDGRWILRRFNDTTHLSTP